MMSDYINQDYLIATENRTLLTINDRLWGLTEDYPIFLNMLLKLQYFAERGYDVEEPEGRFKSWCYYQYVRIPYTFRSAYILVERGHNLESVILLRHIVEVFVQLRYFHRYPEKLKDHVSGKSRLRFNEIIGEFSIDFYRKWYIKQLSSIAHGGVGVLNFRLNIRSAEDIDVIMGSTYDVYYLGYAVNQLIAFFFGFIRSFEVFFPKFREQTEIKTISQYDEVLKLLEVHMEAQRMENPKSIEWFEWTDPIIRPNSLE